MYSPIVNILEERKENKMPYNDETKCVAEKKETIHDVLDTIERQQNEMMGEMLSLRNNIKGDNCEPTCEEGPQKTPDCLFDKVRLARDQNERIGRILREIAQTI